MCGRVGVSAGNSLNAHDVSESLNVSVEREKTVEDIPAPDKRSIFVVRIGFADTRSLRRTRCHPSTTPIRSSIFYRL
jgi:hypothetical protein